MYYTSVSLLIAFTCLWNVWCKKPKITTNNTKHNPEIGLLNTKLKVRGENQLIPEENKYIAVSS